MGENRSRGIAPTEYLKKLCAYAMSLGMSYEDYWFNHYDLIYYYIEAEEIRQRKRNNELWLQGAYIYQAIGSLTPVLNPFSKDHKARPYLKEPIPITQKDIDEREERKVQQMKDYLMSRVKKQGG